MNRKRVPPSMIAGSVILIFFALIAIFADKLMPFEMDQMFKPYQKPGAEHWLGTNDIGQDILSELILGTQVTLLTGTAAAFFVVLIGTAIGVAAGYLGGITDKILSAFTSVFMAIPSLPFTIVLVTFLEPSIWNIVVVERL